VNVSDCRGDHKLDITSLVLDACSAARTLVGVAQSLTPEESKKCRSIIKSFPGLIVTADKKNACRQSYCRWCGSASMQKFVSPPPPHLHTASYIRHRKVSRENVLRQDPLLHTPPRRPRSLVLISGETRVYKRSCSRHSEPLRPKCTQRRVFDGAIFRRVADLGTQSVVEAVNNFGQCVELSLTTAGCTQIVLQGLPTASKTAKHRDTCAKDDARRFRHSAIVQHARQVAG
jgi:hypothetical protein